MSRATTLPETTTEILVELKHSPQDVFGEGEPYRSNYFRFRLSPDVMISLGARTKVPGEAMRGDAVELVARHQPSAEMAPYERLLGDAIRGDPALFVREDSVEAAWKVVDAVLGNVTPAYAYTPHTWGPLRPTRSSRTMGAGTTRSQKQRNHEELIQRQESEDRDVNTHGETDPTRGSGRPNDGVSF